jgi:hypothetical protein
MQYSITVSSQKEDDSYNIKWAMKVAQVYFDEPLEASVFKVS